MATTDYYNGRKSGQIPAFGDWENADDMPITQYFECARQAGLVRCSCSGECCASYVTTTASNYTNNATSWGELYAAEKRKAREVNKGRRHSNEQRKQVKVRDLVDQPRSTRPSSQNQYTKKYDNKPVKIMTPQQSRITVKPVDEDLYKIPSELLENSKRKKMLGFFTRCMVPPCAA